MSCVWGFFTMQLCVSTNKFYNYNYCPTQVTLPATGYTARHRLHCPPQVTPPTTGYAAHHMLRRRPHVTPPTTGYACVVTPQVASGTLISSTISFNSRGDIPSAPGDLLSFIPLIFASIIPGVTTNCSRHVLPSSSSCSVAGSALMSSNVKTVLKYSFRFLPSPCYLI